MNHESWSDLTKVATEAHDLRCFQSWEIQPNSQPRFALTTSSVRGTASRTMASAFGSTALQKGKETEAQDPPNTALVYTLIPL